jgi:hypothetical protein
MLSQRRCGERHNAHSQQQEQIQDIDSCIHLANQRKHAVMVQPLDAHHGESHDERRVTGCLPRHQRGECYPLAGDLDIQRQ